MPHSVSPEPVDADGDVVDMVPDVETTSVSPIEEEQDMYHEMTMSEASVQGDTMKETPTAAEAISKPEVKLEDLFADVESDEEFPSSNVQDTKMLSSPEAPASPMLVKIAPLC
jgi:DNA primase small subunit